MEIIAASSYVQSEVVADDDDVKVSQNPLILDKEHAVVSSDDLLIEILLRLPVISLVLFKSVSKHWLSVITSATFTSRRSRIPNIDPPSGFLLQELYAVVRNAFVPLDSRIAANKYRLHATFTKAANNFKILQSCNGLLLCCIKARPNKFYVYNPCMNWFKMLPQCHEEPFPGDKRMAFDPTKSPHYKVFHSVPIFDAGFTIQIQIYSSETGVWSIYGERFDKSFVGFNEGIYLNDAFHWLSCSLNEPPVHYKLDIVDNLFVTTIHNPPTLDQMVNAYCKLVESRGCLLLLCSDYTSYKELNIYEMRNGCSEWSVKYFVNLDDFKMPFPKIWRIWSIVLGEREEDSFMVMELFDTVVQYKIILKTVRKLCELGSVHISPLGSFLFIASFAGV